MNPRSRCTAVVAAVLIAVAGLVTPAGAAPAGRVATYAYIAVSRAGAAVYVNALIKQASPAGPVRSGGRVVYLQRLLGSAWQTTLSRVTNAQGVFTVGFVQRTDLSYRLVVIQSARAFGATSAAVASVTPAPAVTSAAIAVSRSGNAVYVNALVKQTSGGVTSRSAGRLVYVQRNLPGGWQNILSRTTNAQGVFTVGFVSAADYEYRLVVLATSTAGAAVSGVAASSTPSWPTDHGNNLRTGYNATAHAYRGLSTAFTVTLDGAVYASPILVGSSLIVATENNTVYSLDAQTGARRWVAHLRTPAPTSTLACSGNISPSGITGTPAYDPVTRRVFVVTNSVSAQFGAHHEIFGLSAATGAVQLNGRIAVPGTAENAEQQRGALAVWGGYVYVPFGGLAGDCGQYKGAVLSLKANGAPGGTAWVVPTAREGGIWAPGGPVVGSDGSAYVAIGNGASTSGAFDGSDSVTRLSPTSDRLDFFAPTTWPTDNASDLDLGSMTPALTANGYVLQAGKSGIGYVLRASHLGGIGGQVSSGSLCTAFGVSAVIGSTVFLPCTGGVRRVEVASNGTFTAGWTAPNGVNGSPVAGPGAVYSISDGRLYALAPDTGQILGSVALGSATTRFATSAMNSDKLYVPTTTGVVAVRFG